MVNASIATEAPVTLDSSTLSDHERMRQHFAKMEKVEIKIPKDRGSQFVQVNGYTFEMAAGVSMKVPKQIAQMLRDAEVI